MPRPGDVTERVPGGDAVAIRLWGWVRVAVTVSVAAIGSFTVRSGSDEAWFFLFVALVGIPWATVLVLLSDRTERPLLRYAGPIGDALGVFAFQLAGPATAAGLVAHGPIVAFVAYVGGRRAATWFAGLTLGLSWLSGTGWKSLAVLAGAEAGLVLLISGLTGQRDRAQALSRHLDARASTILDRVREAIVVTDACGAVRQMNEAARGLHAGSGASCGEVLRLHKGERPLDCSRGCALLAHPGDVEVWRPAGDGRRQPLLAGVAALRDPGGDVVEVVHSLRDITALKQAEEAKTLFLATASHELKTPLTVIQGFAQTLLANRYLAGEQRDQALEAVVRRSIELAKIVDRLLLSSRIEAGRAEVRVEETHAAEVLEERVSALRASTNRLIELSRPDPLPPVLADATALATVFDHLLDNAVKYSPLDRGVAVAVQVQEAAVVVEVADRGIGMTEEQVRHCFDKFWQAETGDVRRFGGTGIGLYIVRSLVEAMGGRVWVASAPGEGSRFVVELRRVDWAEPKREAPAGEPSLIREFMRQLGVRDRKPVEAPQ